MIDVLGHTNDCCFSNHALSEPHEVLDQESARLLGRPAVGYLGIL